MSRDSITRVRFIRRSRSFAFDLIKWNGEWNHDEIQVSETVVQRCSVAKEGVVRNFAKFTGKHLCTSLFFNKVAGLRPLLKKRLWHRPSILLKKRLWYMCFRVNFAKFLRTSFLIEHLWRRLLLRFFRQLVVTCLYSRSCWTYIT